ncbi:MAG: ComF family protein [Gammaproteobacteria bacterium]|nr:ComF family protein [Gammaproteobacteria bacterium]
MKHFIQFLQHQISSSHCILCNKEADIEISLCPQCINNLPINQQACIYCAIPLSSNTKQLICGHCQKNPFIFDQSFSPFLYHDSIIPLIHQLKYQEKLYIARTLAKLFTHQLQKINFRKPDALVPIPLHTSKYKQRGYNQTQEITNFISKELHIPIDNQLLVRKKPTISQQSLNAKQRQNNMKDAFEVKQENNMIKNYHHITLIDDVMTTGNTLQSAAKQLKKSGISVIDTWTIARA